MDKRQLLGKDSLIGEDLNGKDVTLTIDRAVRTLVAQKEEIYDEKTDSTKTVFVKKARPVIYFREMIERNRKDPLKPNMRLILNATNIDSIIAVHGEDSDQWAGKKITLYPLRGKFFGKEQDAIRIRKTAPK